MKKFLLGLLSMMFSCALALGVSSCGGKGKDNDNQTMTENVFSGNDSVDSENSSSETEKPLESESSATHVCVFDDWYETKGAKCEEEGEERRDCTCGNYETRPIVQTGHSFTAYKSNNDAECEKDGTKTATCDNGCGKTETLTDEPRPSPFVKSCTSAKGLNRLARFSSEMPVPVSVTMNCPE